MKKGAMPSQVHQKEAGDIALPFPALSVFQTCGEVFNWLLANPNIPAAAVVTDDDVVAGLVNR